MGSSATRLESSSYLRAVVALFTIAAAVPAQSGRVIRGMVVDVRDQPVASVAVAALGATTAVTDDSGRFRLDIPHRDRIAFDARRVGFMPSRTGIGPGGDTSVSVLLLPSAQRMTAVEVAGTVIKPPSLAGFELRMLERKKGAGSGHFITAKDIEVMAPTRATQVVENIPSVMVRRIGGDRFAIFGKAPGRGDCPATVYLDGIRLGGSGEQAVDRRGRAIGRDNSAPIDQYVTPAEIAGVEVYSRGTSAPPQFQPPTEANGLRCAIVVYWTKHSG